MSGSTHLQLAERLRTVIGSFVRRTRDGSGTPSDARSETLGLLDRCGPLSTATLARLRAVTHQTMRVVLADMEVNMLIQSANDPKDGRARLYRLTPKGEDQLRGLRAAKTRWIATRLDDLLSDEEREILARAIMLLERITKS